MEKSYVSTKISLMILKLRTMAKEYENLNSALSAYGWDLVSEDDKHSTFVCGNEASVTLSEALISSDFDMKYVGDRTLEKEELRAFVDYMQLREDLCDIT